jgi:hypothetical protein
LDKALGNNSILSGWRHRWNLTIIEMQIISKVVVSQRLGIFFSSHKKENSDEKRNAEDQPDKVPFALFVVLSSIFFNPYFHHSGRKCKCIWRKTNQSYWRFEISFILIVPSVTMILGARVSCHWGQVFAHYVSIHTNDGTLWRWWTATSFLPPTHPPFDPSNFQQNSSGKKRQQRLLFTRPITSSNYSIVFCIVCIIIRKNDIEYSLCFLPLGFECQSIHYFVRTQDIKWPTGIMYTHPLP